MDLPICNGDLCSSIMISVIDPVKVSSVVPSIIPNLPAISVLLELSRVFSAMRVHLSAANSSNVGMCHSIDSKILRCLVSERTLGNTTLSLTSTYSGAVLDQFNVVITSSVNVMVVPSQVFRLTSISLTVVGAMFKMSNGTFICHINETSVPARYHELGLLCIFDQRTSSAALSLTISDGSLGRQRLSPSFLLPVRDPLIFRSEPEVFINGKLSAVRLWGSNLEGLKIVQILSRLSRLYCQCFMQFNFMHLQRVQRICC